MASSLRPMVRLATRPQSHSIVSRPVATQFHTSRPTNATPAGPPPTGFRLPKPKRFDEGESSLNKASNYFLLTEIFRGMYVVLEQYFRPPYVMSKLHCSGLTLNQATQSTTHLKKDQYLLDSVANMLFEDTHQEKNDVSPANYVKRSVQHKQLQLKRKKEKMEVDVQLDMTSI